MYFQKQNNKYQLQHTCLWYYFSISGCWFYVVQCNLWLIASDLVVFTFFSTFLLYLMAPYFAQVHFIVLQKFTGKARTDCTNIIVKHTLCSFPYQRLLQSSDHLINHLSEQWTVMQSVFHFALWFIGNASDLLLLKTTQNIINSSMPSISNVTLKSCQKISSFVKECTARCITSGFGDSVFWKTEPLILAEGIRTAV